MATFEQVMELMKQMSQEQIQAAMTENQKDCGCKYCPSYMGTGETELLYCALGKSNVITEEEVCACPVCPVQKNMALRWDYYCTKGSGAELLQREAK